MDITKLPKEIANKIINNTNEIKISEKQKIWKYIHDELIKGYTIEENGNLIIFHFNKRLTYAMKSFTNCKKKWVEIYHNIIKRSYVEPNNYLNYTDESFVSSIELKYIDYYWIERIPRLVSY